MYIVQGGVFPITSRELTLVLAVDLLSVYLLLLVPRFINHPCQYQKSLLISALE